MLEQLAGDMLAEYQELDSLVSSLPLDAWETRTGFFNWTVRDQILHLHQVDLFGLASLRDPFEFAEVKKTVRAAQATGLELKELVSREFEGIDVAGVLAAWRDTYRQLISQCGESNSKARIHWFGPDMSVVSFASSRQMEVWAHGQDIYDALGKKRSPTARIRNICELGVRTFGWSFSNRGLHVPATPHVELEAPSGAIWMWPGEGADFVKGRADDFALVVTQRRAVEDTGLIATGAAQHWLVIAQCFAGAPQERAAPGSRPSR